MATVALHSYEGKNWLTQREKGEGEKNGTWEAEKDKESHTHPAELWRKVSAGEQIILKPVSHFHT